MATDEFAYKPKDRDDPATNGVAVTPNDSTDLSNVTRGVYIGVGGNLQVTLEDMADGASITLSNVAGGIILPLRAKRIWATSTTATGIVGLW